MEILLNFDNKKGATTVKTLWLLLLLLTCLNSAQVTHKCIILQLLIPSPISNLYPIVKGTDKRKIWWEKNK